MGQLAIRKHFPQAGTGDGGLRCFPSVLSVAQPGQASWLAADWRSLELGPGTQLGIHLCPWDSKFHLSLLLGPP